MSAKNLASRQSTIRRSPTCGVFRDYDAALGYAAPYEWAHYAEVPFQPTAQAALASCVTIVTTAAPISRTRETRVRGRLITRRPVSTPSIPARARRRASRMSPSTARTPRPYILVTYFPLSELRRGAASGRVGSVAARFHGVPTQRSARATLEVDAPDNRCALQGRRGGRHPRGQLPRLPPNGEPRRPHAGSWRHPHRRPGCAKDIVEHVGVPRCASPIFRWATRRAGRATSRRRPRPSSSRCAFSRRLRPRARDLAADMERQLRHWKLDYCNVERLAPRRSRAGAPSSTRKRRPGVCAKGGMLLRCGRRDCVTEAARRRPRSVGRLSASRTRAMRCAHPRPSRPSSPTRHRDRRRPTTFRSPGPLPAITFSRPTSRRSRRRATSSDAR